MEERTSDSGGPSLVALAMALLLVMGLALGVGVSYRVWGDSGDQGPDAGTGCREYRTIDLTVAPELFHVVTGALEDIGPECARVVSLARTGAEVASGVSIGGDLPDIWIPESRFWADPAFVGEGARLRTVSQSLARTAVLLVGGPDGRRFGSWGEAETSGLVTIPDPMLSAAGALAAAAPRAEARALGRSPAEAREMIVPFAQNYGARRARGADVAVATGMFSARSRRLVVSTEQELGAAREGAAFLRDLTPSVGALSLDFPMLVQDRSARVRGAARLARDLGRYLATEAGSAALREEGLRDPGGGPSQAGASDVTTFLPTPPAATIVETVQSWGALSVPSAFLAVVDVSGSMDFPTGEGTRMELLADAAGVGLSFLPDHARVGLWIFSIDKGGPGKDWRVLEPTQRLDKLTYGRTQRFALRQRAEQLPSLTEGGTGLYDTALAAYQNALRHHRPYYSNAVVLMTDGRNEDPGSIELPALLSRLRELRDPARPVRIVGIAISEDADLGALQEMARVTGGAAYSARRPEDVLEVFAKAVLSR